MVLSKHAHTDALRRSSGELARRKLNAASAKARVMQADLSGRALADAFRRSSGELARRKLHTLSANSRHGGKLSHGSERNQAQTLRTAPMRFNARQANDSRKKSDSAPDRRVSGGFPTNARESNVPNCADVLYHLSRRRTLL
ncbi:MAG: hypothetical protein PUD68_08320 [Clostridiales bacterium]|nr:hypothetical protein [Clostridiales bacterium]